MGFKAHVVTEDSASGAQIIEGSLRFDPSKNQYLQRTFGSGNRRTFTLSYWIKEHGKGTSPFNNPHILWSGTAVETRGGMVHRGTGATDAGRIYMFNQVSNTTNSAVWTNSFHRDFSAWKHVVFRVDSTISSPSTNRVLIYINGVEQEDEYKTTPAEDLEFQINLNQEHRIGRGIPDDYGNFSLSQYYFIDGQALGPENFGFTDPLTNTWRPKKYTGTFTGTNTFYLPMDGNTPVGEDQSGNNNDWLARGFGGTASIDKATGAFPILNTVNGGRVATAGVRTDSSANSLILAVPFFDIATDVSDVINSGSSAKTLTLSNVDATDDRTVFYGGSHYINSSDTITFPGTDWFSHTNFTLEFWANITDYGDLWTVDGNNCSWTIGTGAGISIDGNGIPRVNFGGSSNINIPLNKWMHFAYVKSGDGSVYNLYVNGRKADASSTGNGQNSGQWILGGTRSDVNDRADWYVQDLRYYTTAKYSESFVVPSTIPEITPDSPSGVVGGSAPSKIVSGSFVTDGDGDYLQVPNHADLRFGSGDFCVEGFIYFSETSGNATVAGLWNSGANRRSWLLQVEADNRRLRGFFSTDGSSVTQVNGSTGQMTRNAWHHVAFTRGSSAFKVFLDGIEVGSAASSSSLFDNSNDDIGVGSAQGGTGSDTTTGFISNVRIIKGSQVYNADFTPPTNPLTAITNTKLLCAQSSTSATDAAVIPTGSITANGDAVASNFSPFNTNINTVRGQVSGYPTLDPNNRISNAVLSNNNLTWTCNNSDSGTVLANVAVDSGKYYWEVTVDNGHRFHAGVHVSSGPRLAPNDAGLTPNDWAFRSDGAKVHNNTESTTNFSNVSAIGNVIQLAYDADGGNLWFGANGLWFEGNPSTLSGPSYTGVTSTSGISPFLNRRTNDNGASINFGQYPFKYVPPTGFSPINSASIRAASGPIANPTQYVDVITYSGSSSSSNFVTGLNFNSKPDFVWIKSRSGNSSPDTQHHYLVDSVRGANGASGTAKLYSDDDDEENGGQTATTNGVRFILNGFELTTDNDGTNDDNEYVAWCWKAGGDKGTFNRDGVGYASAAAAGLSAGTITPTGASIGTRQGFSIITWTGTGSAGDIPHGLTQDPDVIMIKNRQNNSTDWYVFGKHIDSTFDDRLTLNSVGNAVSSSSALNGTSAISSTIVKLGANEGTNGSSDNMLMYAWHNVPGVQKFGTYKGNGSDNGPMIKLGFRPALVIVKSMDANEPWAMYDNARRTFNPNSKGLYANEKAEENDGSGRYKDFLSDGFRVIGTSGEQNTADNDYFYMAWAEAPAFNLYGAQSNAR